MSSRCVPLFLLFLATASTWLIYHYLCPALLLSQKFLSILPKMFVFIFTTCQLCLDPYFPASFSGPNFARKSRATLTQRRGSWLMRGQEYVFCLSRCERQDSKRTLTLQKAAVVMVVAVTTDWTSFDSYKLATRSVLPIVNVCFNKDEQHLCLTIH